MTIYKNIINYPRSAERLDVVVIMIVWVHLYRDQIDYGVAHTGFGGQPIGENADIIG